MYLVSPTLGFLISKYKINKYCQELALPWSTLWWSVPWWSPSWGLGAWGRRWWWRWRVGAARQPWPTPADSCSGPWSAPAAASPSGTPDGSAHFETPRDNLETSKPIVPVLYIFLYYNCFCVFSPQSRSFTWFYLLLLFFAFRDIWFSVWILFFRVLQRFPCCAQTFLPLRGWLFTSGKEAIKHSPRTLHCL